MIRLQASVVLTVRDGYSGRPITASAVQCFLDGRRFLPQYRQGGHLVFLNLEAGRHELLLQGTYFQKEQLQLEIGDRLPAEYSVTLKPSATYPFHQEITRLAVQLGGEGAAGQAVWVAVQGTSGELRLAQDEAAAGSRELKAFYRGSSEGRFPGYYLICDKGKSEVVLLTALEGEQAGLGTPLIYAHRRGVVLLPAQCYYADEKGQIQAFFREAVQVCLFRPQTKAIHTLPLQEGYNEFALEKAQKKE